jgi:peptidoglycan/LPS O-acetylase OafA/YrhL
MGVFTFFIISGFLLARSLAHDPSVIHFGINRILRIYPGFIFCVLVTALVLGPIGSSLNWRQYFSNPETSGYITAAISRLSDAGILPDVYAYKGVKDVQTVVNGSLWSLSFEVLSYLLLAFMWVAFRNIKVLLLAAATIFPAIYRSIPGVTYTLPYFAGGVFMYVVYRRFGLSPGIVACCAALLIASSLFGLQHQAFAVFGAYIVVFFGTKPNFVSALAMRIGDFSYGMYLFGWPFGQLMKQYSQTTSPWVLMVLAFPLVLATAAISYYLVERPSLKLKTPTAVLIQRVVAIRNPPQQLTVRIAATLAFLASAAAILTSNDRWWFVTSTLVEVVGWSALAAIIGFGVGKAYCMWTIPGHELPQDRALPPINPRYSKDVTARDWGRNVRH